MELLSTLPARPSAAGPSVGNGLATDLLCAILWMTCVKELPACAQARKCWGFWSRPCALEGLLTWENAIHMLCIEEKRKLSTCHAETADK